MVRDRRHAIVTARATEHVVARAVVRWLGAAASAVALGHLAMVGCAWAWLPPGVPGGRWMLAGAALLGLGGLLASAVAVAWSL